MKFDSQKYIETALKNGYALSEDWYSYRCAADNKYSLRIYTTFICLTYDVSDTECEGLATSLEYDGTGTIYRYTGVPADILMDIAVGPVLDIRKKLYEYEVNKTMEVLG